jgi:hypothetical protein
MVLLVVHLRCSLPGPYPLSPDGAPACAPAFAATSSSTTVALLPAGSEGRCPPDRAKHGIHLMTRPSYLRIQRLCDLVETHRQRPEIDQNRFVAVYGHGAGHWGTGFVRFGGRLDVGPETTISVRVL